MADKQGELRSAESANAATAADNAIKALMLKAELEANEKVETAQRQAQLLMEEASRNAENITNAAHRKIGFSSNGDPYVYVDHQKPDRSSDVWTRAFRKLEDIYAMHCPEKVDKIPLLLEK